MSFFRTIGRTIRTTPPWLTSLPKPEEHSLLARVAGSVFRYHSCNPFYGTGRKRKLEVFNSPAPPAKRLKRGFEESCFTVGETIKAEKGKAAPCFVDFSKPNAKLAQVESKVDYAVKCRLWTFFNMLCLYKGEECTIDRADTDRQHGSCNCGCCQAAHFSLLANLSDTTADDLLALLSKKERSAEIEEKIRHKCKLFGIVYPGHLISELEARLKRQPERGEFIKGLINLAKAEGISEKVKQEALRLGIRVTDSIAEEVERIKVVQKRIYGDISFLNIVANDTVKLPTPVNRYDCLLEASIRPIAIRILNAIADRKDRKKEEAKGFNDETDLPQPDEVKTPYQGMDCLVSWMHSFYDRSEKSINKKISALQELLEAEKHLAKGAPEYQTKVISFRELIGLVEKVREKKEQAEEVSTYAPQIRVGKRFGAWTEILDKIDGWLKEEKTKVSKGEEADLTEKWKQWLGTKASPSRKAEAQLLVSKLKTKSKAMMNKILNTYSLYELLEICGKVDELEKITRQVISQSHGWQPIPLDSDRYSLDTAKKILRLQKAATETPKLQQLFYDVDSNNNKKIEERIELAKLLLVQTVDLDNLSPSAEEISESDEE